MAKNDFWDLSRRPYTRLKLKILKEYLWVWAKIFFNTASKNKDWTGYQDIYYIDCFAGRGKYHYDGQKDIINGSPLIALECASKFQQDTKYEGVKMHCIFVERYKKCSQDLEKFCEPYKGKVDFGIYKEKDFNDVIPDIINRINYHPAFFFIDPDGIKELKKESLEKIISRKSATDILLNYIKGGVERITGLTKKKIPEILNQEVSEKDIKAIKCLTDFYGLSIFDKLNATEKERLQEWTNSLLQSSSLKEKAVFDMPYLHKSDNIYYLLFASRKPVAKKVILSIFKKAKETTYQGQGKLWPSDDKEFEL